MANFNNINQVVALETVQHIQSISKRYEMPNPMMSYLNYFTLYSFAPSWLTIIAAYFDADFPEGIKLSFRFKNENIEFPIVSNAAAIMYPHAPSFYPWSDNKHSEYMEKIRISYRKQVQGISSFEKRIKDTCQKIRFDTELLRTCSNIIVKTDVYKSPFYT